MDLEEKRRKRRKKKYKRLTGERTNTRAAKEAERGGGSVQLVV